MRSSQVTKRLKCLKVGILQSLLLLLLVTTGWATPLVMDMQPPDGSTQPVTTTATATFSEAMDPATITNGSFTVARAVGIKAIAVGENFTVALKGDGTVVGWGGSHGNGQREMPESVFGVKAIAAGRYHVMALKNDGTVVCWVKGKLMSGPDLSGVTAIASGRNHAVALKGDGTVVTWLVNYYDYYGQGLVPSGLSDVIAIAAGNYHTVALKRDGTVVAWFGDATLMPVPEGLSEVAAIAAGSNFTVALKGDGTVVAWGDNRFGQTTVPTGLSGVKAVAAGSQHVVALKKDGTLVAWGDNSLGQNTVPASLSGVTAIVAGYYHSAAQKDDGTVVAWGDNRFNACSVPSNITGASAIASNNYHNIVLKGDGTVVAWGLNANGQTTVPAGLSGVNAVATGLTLTVAQKIDGTAIAWGDNRLLPWLWQLTYYKFKAFAVGYNHVLALREDGTVVSLGYDNTYSQLFVPAGLSGVKAIAAGIYYSVALKEDGTVVAWGWNRDGQTTVPAGLSGVKAIAAGNTHAVALKEDGTVVAWGNNFFGQTTVPPGFSGVKAIAAGERNTVALKEDGTVVVWGSNSSGQTAVPAGLSGVKAVAAGSFHIVALKEDGTMVVWGSTVLPESPYETAVDGAVVYDQSTNTATFTPLAPLAPNATYLSTVNTGARNFGGDHLAADVKWSFSTAGAFAIVTLDNLIQTYDGTLKTVSATTGPAGLTVVITYNGSTTPPTAVGSYSVVATVSDAIFTGKSTGILTITKPTYTVGVAVLGGNGDIQCESPVTEGENSLCAITPAANYHLETFSDNNVDQLAAVSGNTYTISNVVADHAITGTFAINLRADAGPDQTVPCTGPSGAQVTLDGAASIGAATSTWSGPLGTVSGASPTVTIPLGTHTLTLTVADSDGRTASDTVVVTVFDSLPPLITITGVADGMTYNLGLVPQASYAASDAQSGIAESSGIITGTPDAFGCGVFTYTVTATDRAGNTAVASVTYEVKATPQGTSALIDTLVNAGLIPAQTAATLLDSLARALSAYSSDPNLGDNMMNTFQNQINAALQSGKIDAETAALLNMAANYIVTNN